MNIQSNRRLLLWSAIACLLLVAIVFLSVIPYSLDLPGRGDKYAHMAGYGVLMFWCTQWCRTGVSRLLVAVVLAMLGLGLEFVQSYAGRDFGRNDVIADVIGIAIGWLVGPPRTLNLLDRAGSA